MPAYKQPTLNAVRTNLLTTKKAEVDKQVWDQIGDFVHKFDVIHFSDGWDNVQNRPLLNIV